MWLAGSRAAAQNSASLTADFPIHQVGGRIRAVEGASRQHLSLLTLLLLLLTLLPLGLPLI